jgi:hypothetical protein
MHNNIMQSTRSYILDSALIRKAMRARGYRSVQQLANKLGLHRNSLNYFMRGHGVFPVTVELLLNTLDL